MSKWLSWEPPEPGIMANPCEAEPAKPPKPDFVGFAGALSGQNPIAQGTQPTPKLTERKTQQISFPSQPTPESACPFSLPEGVSLISYEKKTWDVAVTVCSVVKDVNKFIRHALRELDARLHSPVQIKAGDSVFDLLSKLADCGLELHLEWPKEQVINDSGEDESSKPKELRETAEFKAYGGDITAKDVSS